MLAKTQDNIPSFIILHCSDSTWGSFAAINQWHKERGFEDTSGCFCGYHYVINNGYATYTQLKDGIRDELLNGFVEPGRPELSAGAHALGYNRRSIGICLVGVDKFSTQQFLSLRNLIKKLCDQYNIPIDRVLGHCETAMCAGKTCPNFNVPAFRISLFS